MFAVFAIDVGILLRLPTLKTYPTNASMLTTFVLLAFQVQAKYAAAQRVANWKLVRRRRWPGEPGK